MPEITDRDRLAFHNHSPNNNSQDNKNSVVSSTALNVAKVFLYMFLGLLISAVVAFATGAILYYNIGVLENENALSTYLVVLVVSVIALFIDMIVINFVTLRGKHSIIIPGLIYTILIGIVFAIFTVIVDWRIIGMAFGITALSFLLMSLIAFISKGNMAPLLIVIMGLGIGAGILALVNWIFILLTGIVYEPLYWIVQFAIFALIMFVTIYDIYRIKMIAENGTMNNNIALYCAFVIYTDFINVFVRILYFLIILFGRRR